MSETFKAALVVALGAALAMILASGLKAPPPKPASIIKARLVKLIPIDPDTEYERNLDNGN